MFKPGRQLTNSKRHTTERDMKIIQWARAVRDLGTLKQKAAELGVTEKYLSLRIAILRNRGLID